MARSELNVGEPHPAAQSAKEYIASLGWASLAMWQESFASCAIEGNRLAEICSETLDRLVKGQPVSDRYILGLAWTIRGGIEQTVKTLEEKHENQSVGRKSSGVRGKETAGKHSSD